MKYFDQPKYDQLTSDIAILECNSEERWEAYRTDSSERIYEQIRAIRQQIKTLEEERQSLPYRFEVGDGAHSGGNGDRYPYRVIGVNKSGKTVTVQAMDYTATEEGRRIGCGHQSWEITDNPEGHITTITLRSNGRWAQKGASSQGSYGNFSWGAYYSYNWEF